MQRWVGLCLLCCLSLTCWRSAAQVNAPAAPLALEAVPLLGANTPIGTGWFVCAVRITNPGRAQVSGFIELRSELSWTSDPIRSTTRAPFSVAGQGVVTVQLPTHGFGVSPP